MVVYFTGEMHPTYQDKLSAARAALRDVSAWMYKVAEKYPRRPTAEELATFTPVFAAFADLPALRADLTPREQRSFDQVMRGYERYVLNHQALLHLCAKKDVYFSSTWQSAYYNIQHTYWYLDGVIDGAICDAFRYPNVVLKVAAATLRSALKPFEKVIPRKSDAAMFATHVYFRRHPDGVELIGSDFEVGCSVVLRDVMVVDAPAAEWVTSVQFHTLTEALDVAEGDVTLEMDLGCGLVRLIEPLARGKQSITRLCGQHMAVALLRNFFMPALTPAAPTAHLTPDEMKRLRSMVGVATEFRSDGRGKEDVAFNDVLLDFDGSGIVVRASDRTAIFSARLNPARMSAALVGSWAVDPRILKMMVGLVEQGQAGWATDDEEATALFFSDPDQGVFFWTQVAAPGWSIIEYDPIFRVGALVSDLKAFVKGRKSDDLTIYFNEQLGLRKVTQIGAGTQASVETRWYNFATDYTFIETDTYSALDDVNVAFERPDGMPLLTKVLSLFPKAKHEVATLTVGMAKFPYQTPVLALAGEGFEFFMTCEYHRSTWRRRWDYYGAFRHYHAQAADVLSAIETVPAEYRDPTVVAKDVPDEYWPAVVRYRSFMVEVEMFVQKTTWTLDEVLYGEEIKTS